MRLEFKTIALAELKDIFTGADYERLKESILAIILRQKDLLFKKGIDPDGKPWQPLSESTMKRKMAKNAKITKNKKKIGQVAILVDTSNLKNSLSIKGAAESFQSIDGDEIIVGTNVEYASIHNYGGTVQMQSRGDVQMVERSETKSFEMPARPFIGFGDRDDEQISEKLNAYIGKYSKESA